MNSRNESVSASQATSKILEECLYFLHSTSCLMNVESCVMRYENMIEKHPSNEFLPRLHYPLEIDLSALHNISDKLFNLFVNEPNMAMYILHKALYAYILSKIRLDDFQLQQLNIPLKIKPGASLPLRNTMNIPYGVLTSFQGSILSISTRSKYISSYVIKCGEENCPNGLGERGTGSIPSQMPLCCVCGNSMTEIPEAQEMEERIIGSVVQLPEMVNKVSSSIRRQSITVCFQDDLMSKVEPGLKYEIAGYKGIEYFHAMSLIPKFYLCKELTSETIPNSICLLHHQVRNVYPNSPWAFVGLLASQFAISDYPASCYFNLKMGLLLSLASLRPDAKPVPVLAVGPDTHIAHRLMRKAAALRKRGTVLEWAGSSPNGQVHWETTGSEDLCWIEAGPLLLASGGICCLGDWAKLKGKASQSIIKVLESNRVSLDSNRAKSIPLPSFPLRSSVWSYMLLNNIQNKQWKTSQTQQLKSLIQVFGVPFLASDEKNSETMVHFTLLKCLKSNQETLNNPISDEDFHEYLGIATSKNPSISFGASQLVQKYFVASRRAHPDHLPVNAVSTITSLAEAYARLSLADEVLPQHVAAVIQLYEETFVYLYGMTNFSFPHSIPPQHEFCAAIHQSMEEFTVWLENFIHVFEGSSSQSYEENIPL